MAFIINTTVLQYLNYLLLIDYKYLKNIIAILDIQPATLEDLIPMISLENYLNRIMKYHLT